MKYKEYLNYTFPDEEYIHFSYFISLADFYFHGMDPQHDWWDGKIARYPHIRKIKRSIKDENSVLYCYGRTDALPHCFRLCKSHASKKYVIILSRTDKPVTQELTQLIPENVTLLAHNIGSEHPRAIPLPNGVKLDRHDIRKQDIQNWIGNCKIPNGFDFSNRRMLYCNFSLSQHIGYRRRNRMYKKLKRHSWITFSHMGSFMKYKLSQAQYHDETWQHKFTLCPIGGGIDTYRVWEALYLKSIPIVEQNNHWQGFKNLPILVIRSYRNITHSFLEEKYEEMLNRDINIEKLTFSFWKRLVTEKIDRHDRS